MNTASLTFTPFCYSIEPLNSSHLAFSTPLPPPLYLGLRPSSHHRGRSLTMTCKFPCLSQASSMEVGRRYGRACISRSSCNGARALARRKTHTPREHPLLTLEPKTQHQHTLMIISFLSMRENLLPQSSGFPPVLAHLHAAMLQHSCLRSPTPHGECFIGLQSLG